MNQITVRATLGSALCALALMGVSACGEETPPAKPVAAATAAAALPAPTPVQAIQSPAPVTAPGAVSAPAAYTYDFTVRDPFRPYILQVEPDQSIDSCGPLCTYDVGQFEVTGIIWGISQPAAMLRSPEGKPYIVKVGSPIGRNKGKVVSISKERIAVLEKYVNYRGEVVTNRVDIELPAEGGTRK